MNHQGLRVWDVAIVGAGPSGSAAALGALLQAPHARVLLLDRNEFPRDKACGDGIPPQALRLLDDLGVPEAAAGFAPVRALHLGFAGFARAQALEGALTDPAYVVPRKVFDARLVAAAGAAGATFRRHHVRRLEHRRDAIVLDDQIHARVVVAADGANSVLRRLTGTPAASRRHVAVAIRGYAPVQPAHAHVQVITFACHDWPAYAWSFPIGDGRANVGYGEVLPAAGSLTRDYLINRLDALLPGAATRATAWRAHHLPLSSGRPRQPNGRVLLAGDALSLINPLTGEGIYYAVLSGALAGQASVDAVAAGAEGGAGAAYRAALRRELSRHLRHTTAAARLAHQPALVKRTLRAAGDSQVFDDLVELGLGRGLMTPRLIGKILRPPPSER